MDKEIEIMIINYKENLNLMGKINAELCKRFGLEYYLTEFSSNLIRALHQYERFLEILDDQANFLKIILDFSNACITYFDPSCEDSTSSKADALISKMNEINDKINNDFGKSIQKYI